MVLRAAWTGLHKRPAAARTYSNARRPPRWRSCLRTTVRVRRLPYSGKSGHSAELCGTARLLPSEARAGRRLAPQAVTRRQSDGSSSLSAAFATREIQRIR